MRFTLLRFATLVATASLVACAAEESDDATQAEALEARSDMGALRFRDILYTYLKREGRSDADIQKLVYLPTDAVLNPAVPAAASPAGALLALDQRMSATRPSQLYSFGARTPFEAVQDVDAPFASQGPVTIVLIPGIFGEFIDNTPFQEVLSKTQSSAAREWAEKSAAARGPDATDAMYSLDALGEVQYPIADLMKVASIDGPDGKPQVRLVFPKPKTGSLETFGTLEKNNRAYVRRLTKYFKVMGGAPEKFYLLGYSRGTPVALDLAVRARASSQAAAWSSHLAGVLTLGGVLYGSPLADQAKDASTVTGTLIARLKRLGSELEECVADENALTRARKTTENSARWVSAGAELAWIYRRTPSHDELTWEGIDANLPENGRFGEMLKNIVFRDALHLDRPVSDYCENISRFRVLLREVLAGVDTLTTSARLDWWKRNTIPGDMRMFAITGTMGDISRARGSVWPLVSNPLAYNPGSIDFKSLRQNYYDLYAAGGTELNDSQVPVSRGRFWPALMQQSNAAQPQLSTYYLGVLGTHHWGFAFPEATPTRGVGVNPFPRGTLLKAMARFIAEAQTR